MGWGIGARGMSKILRGRLGEEKGKGAATFNDHPTSRKGEGLAIG